MPTLTETVESYMYSDEIASLAKSTRVRTGVVLRDLITVAGPKLIVSRLNRLHIDKTVASWRARGLTENSINNYKAHLRQFCEFLLDSRLVRDNPSRHLKTVKTVVSYEKRRPLTAAQVTKVVRAAEMFHERDRVCVLLAIYSGFRASELVSLRWQDVDFEAGVIRVFRQKMTDIHIIPMADALVGILTAWKATWEARYGVVRPEYLVVPALVNHAPVPGVTKPSWELKLNPMKRQSNFRQRLKGYMKTAKVPNAHLLGVHALRRTSGNLALDAGMDVRDVQHLLGHASERQTQHYLSRDIAREKLAERMRGWKI